MTPALRKTLMITTLLLTVLAPARSFAHGGGPLDANGCHYDHRVHDYHCHSGKLRGKHFKSRADMLRMLKTGEDTSIAESHPGHFQDLAKSLKNHLPGQSTQAGVPATPTVAGQQGVQAAGTATAATTVPATAAPVSIEQRLSVLKQLYEKDLITKREYDEKRQQIIDSL